MPWVQGGNNGFCPQFLVIGDIRLHVLWPPHPRMKHFALYGVDSPPPLKQNPEAGTVMHSSRMGCRMVATAWLTAAVRAAAQ